MSLQQMALVGDIMRAVEKQGVNGITQRQMNAIIEAANLICGAFEKPYTPSTPGGGVAQWLASDETGLSSKYLLMALRNEATKDHFAFAWPHDPSDFGRCVGLLDAVPELRDKLNVMRDANKHGAQWAALARNWTELEALYREELPSGNATKLMARMEELTGESHDH